jgi:hypothetical protein
MKDFLKGSFRTAVAIFLALLGLILVLGAYSIAKDFYRNQEAKQYEQVRGWSVNLDNIGLNASAKTKFVDGKILVSVGIAGYPKYLSNPRNADGSLNFDFLDHDGFKLVSKPIQLSEFTRVVDSDGKNAGLRYQFAEYIGLDRYKQLDHMQVEWHLITEVAPELPVAAEVPPPPKPGIDHCAPDLSKGERLRRLAQFGRVRETGMGQYTAGWHSVSFLVSTGELLSCR